jgi:hypothetical protein
MERRKGEKGVRRGREDRRIGGVGKEEESKGDGGGRLCARRGSRRAPSECGGKWSRWDSRRGGGVAREERKKGTAIGAEGLCARCGGCRVAPHPFPSTSYLKNATQPLHPVIQPRDQISKQRNTFASAFNHPTPRPSEPLCSRSFYFSLENATQPLHAIVQPRDQVRQYRIHLCLKPSTLRSNIPVQSLFSGCL